MMKLGYTLFYVDDVEKTMSFYSEAFGIEKGFLHESKQYGEMVTGETKIGFVHHDTAGSHGFEYERSQPKNKPFAFEIGFVTKDVEAAFVKAVNAGADPSVLLRINLGDKSYLTFVIVMDSSLKSALPWVE